MQIKRATSSCDYYWVESVVESYIALWQKLNFDAVVAIARGGLAPALITSTALDVPLFALTYERANREVSWFTAKTPQTGAKVLLVEDIAGRGTTLSDSIDFLRNQGYNVTVFTLAYDGESRIKPDYGVEIPNELRAWFPWERESITASFGATNNQPSKPEYEYASWAIDLDGVLLPDLPDSQYKQDLDNTLKQRDLLPPHTTLPNKDLSQLTIITGRPEQDRKRTQSWLNRHGFHGQLVMRDESLYTAAQTASYKAYAITAGNHTHFIESDPIQALEIANLVKVARILWWDGSKALAVYANEARELTRN